MKNRRNATLGALWVRFRWVLLGILAAAVGIYGSAFGPFYAAAIGTVVLIFGVVMVARRTRKGQVLVVIGGGIVIGALAYVALGVLGPNEPAFQSGMGCSAPPGEACENGAERD